MLQNRGRNINDAGLIVAQHAINKQNARYRFGIHNMVSAPAPHIVLQQRTSKSAQSRLPRHTKSGIKIHQHIGEYLT